jgi:catalase
MADLSGDSICTLARAVGYESRYSIRRLRGKEICMAGSSVNLKPFPVKAFAIIATVVGVVATAFACVAGWLPPYRLTPQEMVTALTQPRGPALGHRRNHAKGICFIGTFQANGNGTMLSKAQVFEPGQYTVVGRFNIAGSDPHASDPMAQVRGLGIRITTPDGQEWRSAMIDAPVFAAPTPQAFFALLAASASKDPNAFKQYSAEHPEILTFGAWAKNHPRTESWAEDRFNSLDSFVFINASGSNHVVRWSFVPLLPPVLLTPEDLAKRDSDFLTEDITRRVEVGSLHWRLLITVANPGDPTADPTKPWPADRRTVDAGILIVKQIELEDDGPCRDINYDPAVLPPGITTSDDPFPAARSAAYRVSYDSRMDESSKYPRARTGRKQ